MEPTEMLGTLRGGLGLAGKLMGKGVDEMSKALKSKDDGSETLESGLYFQPDHAPEFALKATSRFFEAQTAARPSAGGFLKNLTTPGGDKLFAAACGLLMQGDLNGSIARLRETINKDSTLTDAYFVLGTLLLEQGQASEAMRHFDTALLTQQRLGKSLRKNLPSFGVNLWLTRRSVFCLFPDLVGLNVLLALSQRQAGKLEDAAHSLEQLLKVLPGEPVTNFFLAVFRLEEGKPREVYELLREFLPDSNLQTANLLLLGLSCAALGDPITARELYRKALQQVSLDPMLRLDLRYALGDALIAEGWAQDGNQEHAAVIAEDPGYVPFAQRLGLKLPGSQPPAQAQVPEPKVTEDLTPEQAPTPEPARPPVPVDGSPTVVSRITSQDGQIDLVLGDDPVVIGREEGTIVLAHDTAASRSHARISREGEFFWVEDLGSTNGTWVNRHRITKRVELNVGDLIQVGETRFEVR
ncbi:MAG: hypothetical protein AMXMBFR33_27450 [Candidatus Xenobia bacterium]